ncbi:esterase family protein [Geomicrobium sp. JCM 19039]|uniref:alpha/beta hydrolase n=1 Tax=Geomicrobium sp. JCM 19039 TaxID=1460636 RepID=UPI0009DED1D7|nr:alpha/beta hydrolase-fold protein [Geomicrobium sp. JCM 19039]
MCPDTIVVGVPYPRVSTRRLWYAPLGEQKDDYIRFLKDELLPFLSERYHLLGSAEARLLLGDSLSASLTLMACIQEPDTFQRAVMFSPYVDDTLLSLVANSDDLHRFTVYHTLGNKEDDVKATDGRILDFVTMNEQLHAALDGTLKHYQYKVIEAGNHTWFTWAPELPHALEYHWS